MARGSETAFDRRQPLNWIFEQRADEPALAVEPRSLRHPEVAGVWRLAFDAPLIEGWYAIDWACGPVGVVDARLTLLFADGGRLPQPLAKTGRNRCKAMFRPLAPIVAIEVELAGSTPASSWPTPRLRRVTAGEQRLALLRRCLHVLRGDPRSLPWRAARFLIQMRRQGRATIPVSTTVRSDAEAYALWRERFDEREEDVALHEARLAAGGVLPRFSVIADPDITGLQATALVASLVAQVHGDWELFLPGGAADPRVRPMPEGASTAERLNAAVALASGAFLMLPRAGTRFRPHLFLVFGLTARRVPGARLIYADDDDIRAGERRDPRFKPAWSPLRAGGRDYVGDPCCFEAELLRATGRIDDAEPGDLRHGLLRRAGARLDHDAFGWNPSKGMNVIDSNMMEHDVVGKPMPTFRHHALGPADVVHVAQVLSHVDVADAAVRSDGGPRAPRTAHSTVSRDLLVSIIIPTRDHADLLRLSVGSILTKTTYPSFEILVVDNGSREAETLRLFESWAEDPRIRVLKDPRPFNYSALNNAAVAQARGSIVALVNNDIEVVEPRWLDEMVDLAARPGIGCVGAKLAYPDGRLQHGGVVTGVGGAAGHRHKRAARGAAGRLDALLTVNEVSAVTGACLVVRKAIYDEVGGLDAEVFAVGYNDVDFCLKVAAAGYRNVFTPFAELYHHESVSRGRDLTAKTMERFNREVLALRLRWGERLIDDPYHSPNLTLDSEDGGIRVQ